MYIRISLKIVLVHTDIGDNNTNGVQNWRIFDVP